ncbi:mannosyl-glycoprotein endo-beta-N-acetylglucosaminidase [Mesobacillus foraminis]|uniref:Mannosyl-glycoprotein endo-beta-N-acetylglucosaminidase n=2 Tax=Mesobacillus foraminis TaxID=279826 RepID=A0A4R2B7F3_9BACI|nr:mannosyl-glycoprotein endo-beta-N-acetylglucosaminidase [Mesobacillus foraminis]
MKKAILPFCFAVLSTAAFNQVVHASENETPAAQVNQSTASTQYVSVNPGSYLNLRASASDNASILTKLANGSSVTVYSISNGWAKVKANGKDGYVSAKYLSSKTSSSKPAEQPKTSTTTQYVSVNPGSYLNLRASASDNASILTKLANGSSVTVYSVSNGWAKVNANGKDGYVSAKYLSSKISSSKPAEQPKTSTTTQYVSVNPGSYLNLRASASDNASILAKLDNDSSVTVYSVSNGWAKVTANGKSGYVSAKYLAPSKSGSAKTAAQPETAAASTQYVSVNPGSYLNLRASASDNASILTKLANGSSVTVYSVSNGWAKVNANGKDGYVSAKYLSSKTSSSKQAEQPKTSATTQYVSVNPGSYLNLRASASDNASILTKLANGSSVTVYSVSNGWAQVNANGKNGYVSAKYLSSAKPGASEAAPAEPTIKYVNVEAGSSLNLRNKPTTKASVILKIAKGKKVSVLSESNGWAKINVYGQEGYVNTQYLAAENPGSKSDSSPESVMEEPLPKADQPAAEPSIAKPSADTYKLVTVDPGSYLNMRSEPSTNAAIITKLDSGTAVTVYKEENGWARVTANGQTGYVSTQYLSEATQDHLDTANRKVNTVYTSYDMTLDEMVKVQLQSNPQTDKKYATYIREDALILNSSTNPTSGVVKGSGWNVRGGAGTNYWAVGTVGSGENLNILSKVKGSDGYDWYAVQYDRAWVNASPEDVRNSLDPDTHVNNPVTSLQFLKLSESTNLDQFEVNEKILTGKGSLAGHAATFLAAGAKHGVNDVYLISHALLETGNGTSQLAQGVEIYGKKVYNMFGIGAYDGSAVTSGAKFAYNAGWFIPEAAIMGGAKFIAQGYISSGQDTLYKMRWNPQGAVAAGAATHQYASDIGWSSKQVKQIHNLYSLLGSYSLTLEVPTFKR